MFNDLHVFRNETQSSSGSFLPLGSALRSEGTGGPPSYPPAGAVVPAHDGGSGSRDSESSWGTEAVGEMGLLCLIS